MPNVEQILLDPVIACTEDELASFKSIAMTMQLDLDSTLGLLDQPAQIVLIEDFKRILHSILTEAGKSDGCPSYTCVTGVAGAVNDKFLAANPALTNKSVVISPAKLISQLTCYEQYQHNTGSLGQWRADACVQISLDFIEKMLLILALTRKYNILHENPNVPREMQRLIHATATFMYAIYLNIIITEESNLPFATDRFAPYASLFEQMIDPLCYLPTVTTFIWATVNSNSTGYEFKSFAEFNSMLSSAYCVNHFADAKVEYASFCKLAQEKCKIDDTDALDKASETKRRTLLWIKEWPEKVRASSKVERAKFSHSLAP